MQLKEKNILNEIHKIEQTKMNMHLFLIHLYNTNAKYYSTISNKIGWCNTLNSKHTVNRDYNLGWGTAKCNHGELGEPLHGIKWAEILS